MWAISKHVHKHIHYHIVVQSASLNSLCTFFIKYKQKTLVSSKKHSEGQDKISESNDKHIEWTLRNWIAHICSLFAYLLDRKTLGRSHVIQGSICFIQKTCRLNSSLRLLNFNRKNCRLNPSSCKPHKFMTRKEIWVMQWQQTTKICRKTLIVMHLQLSLQHIHIRIILYLL